MPTISEDRWNTVIRWIDKLAKPFVIVSVVMYLIEGELSLRNDWNNSYESPPYFLWSERVIAVLFTVEIVVRWWRSSLHPTETARSAIASARPKNRQAYNTPAGFHFPKINAASAINPRPAVIRSTN